jgi:TolB protein
MNTASLPVFPECNLFYVLQLFISLLFVVSIVISTSLGNIPSFEGKTNIGKVNISGSVQIDSSGGVIRMTGSGENIWGTNDAFYFLWNKIDGDATCSVDVGWEGAGKHPHRKAGWMFRAGLEANDPYVDAIVHGDGLISMQYRTSRGDVTKEVQSPIRGAKRVSIERTGDQFTMYVLGTDSVMHPVGTITVELRGQVYSGLAVCSHDSTTKETALLTTVEFKLLGSSPFEKRIVESTLETLNIETGVRSIVHRAKQHFEAPNWSRDGKYFIFNSGGKIYTLPASGGTPQLVNTSFAMKCNNDHGISWDGKDLVISHHADDNKSLIYIVPITGGEPRLVTTKGPSYWHGISPDNKTLAYCAERNGEYDVYTIASIGGKEKRLTSTPGLDDGPEYSPDGKCIYFNSVRTGQMKIWRMKPDGSEQVQFTPTDEYGDWFAHPSPDNKWIIFVSYDKSVEGHPANKNVVLRLMPTAGGEIKIIANLFGGQGTINVHSWSPDSKQFAFVSYRLVIP